MIDSSFLTVIILSEKNIYNIEWINEEIFKTIRNVEKCRKYVWIIIDDGEWMLYNTKKNTEDLNTS